jgi:hypothetical protein
LNPSQKVVKAILEQFAAVATVQYSEESHPDFYCHLLLERWVEHSPGPGFLVHADSADCAESEFASQTLKRFLQLQLPLLPATVSLRTGEFVMYNLNNERIELLQSSGRSLPPFVSFSHTIAEEDERPIGAPLLKCALADAEHREFSTWISSVLLPALSVECFNLHCKDPSSMRRIQYVTQNFSERLKGGYAACPPTAALLPQSPRS